MYYGVQYYPEHWPESRWPIDAAMMQKAGVNTVRMGEFAWSAIEPKEGQLDFGLFDRAIAILADHGIRVLMCTPSRTPPPWVYRKYPGVRNTTVDGKLNNAGFRYLIGLAHPEFVEHAERIDRAVIEHFAGNDAIAGWQVDNEVGQGNDCYCERCRARFHDYLREKYGTVERLNAAWGTHFWSFTFSDFARRALPRPPAASLAAACAGVSPFHVQAERGFHPLARRSRPSARPRQVGHDQFPVLHGAAQRLSPDGDDARHQRDEPLPGSLAGVHPRLLPRHPWEGLVLEQCTRLGPVDIGEGWMRLWAWMAIAHGISGINFFRWRMCRWGQEQHADGILPHGGQENRRYRELTRMGREIKAVGDLIDRTQPQAEVAVLSSYESRWAIEFGVGQKEMRAELDAIRCHTAAGAPERHDRRARSARRPVASRLVIVPRLFCVDAAVAANLVRFVQGGGVLCLTAASGVVDEYNVSFDVPRPGPLRDAAGIEVSDLSPLHEPVALAQHVHPRVGKILEASILADEGAIPPRQPRWRPMRPAGARAFRPSRPTATAKAR